MANLEHSIRRLLKSGTPLHKRELGDKLGLRPHQRRDLRMALQKLVRQGEVIRQGRDRYQLAQKSGGQVVGKIFFRITGEAWVMVPGAEGTERVRIAPPRTGTALPGDRVQIALEAPTQQGRRSSKRKRGRPQPVERSRRPQGKVTRVVERARAEFVGVFRQRGRWLEIEAGAGFLPSKIVVDSLRPETKPRSGQAVLFRILSWEDRHRAALAEIMEVLGPSEAPGMDVLRVIAPYPLHLSFPEEVVAESEEMVARGIAHDFPRENWRDQLVVTIDPTDAKDFDDAISIERDGEGRWVLGVHIADVSHFVRENTALDDEARARGNSCYLVDRVLPMLPESLSNGVCSLVPHEDRATFSAILTIDEQGEVVESRFARTAIHSDRRFTYEEALEIVEGRRAPQGAAEEMLLPAAQLARLLRGRRMAAGSLELDFPDVEVELDAEGVPVSLHKEESDSAHQLIEEFMLAANEAVARELYRHGKPGIYRVHEEPDPGKILELRVWLQSHGYEAGDLLVRREMQDLLHRVHGTPEQYPVQLEVLKSLKRAVYLPDPLGHYGLAKQHYTHFTSPIRRYADLLVHRRLKEILDISEERKRIAISPALCEHLSERERVAADAEKASERLKMLQYFSIIAAVDPPIVLEALVIEARPNGLLVEEQDSLFWGLIPQRGFPSGSDFRYDAVKGAYTDRRQRQSLCPGDLVSVRILRVEEERGWVDFALA